ncbi:MAG: hypothetical protein GX672_04055 [Synergistaceae bacterium]|nr:hypothetical protein [Synergistaceae bacterium]
MSSNYDKIREDNIREYGQGTRHLSFLGRLYTDRTHFIFELLQNAEDAGASKVLFKLFEDRLEVFHDGRLFNEKDVRGICGVGEGTKAKDLTQIGKFGIGFKSVYAYTNTPKIYSGDEHFKIENYVRPYTIQQREIGESSTTLFSFLFDKEDVRPEIVCREISSGLQQLNARTLIFLRKIKEIEYRLPDGLKGVYTRDEVIRGVAREVTILERDSIWTSSQSWLIFQRSVEVPHIAKDCPRYVSVEIGFCLDKNENERGRYEKVVKVKDSTLIVYFPTEKETRLGFLIQGPYKTTPGRDNIPKDDYWNTTLVIETAHLIAEVLPQLKDLGLLSVSMLESLPIRIDDFPPGSMFLPIVESVRQTLANKELLPADDGSFVNAQNAKLARSGGLRDLLDYEQLSKLFQPKDALKWNVMKWLQGSITQDLTPELHKYLLNELGVDDITPERFARIITGNFLSIQADEWLLKFYGFLLGQEALWRLASPGRMQGILRSKPIVRLQDGSHVEPFRLDGQTPNAFMPPPEDTDFPIVKRSIASDEQAENFLKRLGLSEPDVFDDIIEQVLPKYLKNDFFSIYEAEHVDDINKIIRALTSDSVAGRKRVIKKATQTPFLKAVDLVGNVAFKKPSDIYQESPDLRLYFFGLTNVWFLSEQQLVSAVHSNFLIDLGINTLPQIVQFSDGVPPDIKRASTRPEIVINYNLHGLDNFLKSLEATHSFENKKESVVVLWDYLKDHLQQKHTLFKGYYQWYSSRRTDSTYFDSKILISLRNARWIPTRDGSMEKPENTCTGQLLEYFQGAEELIMALGIRQGVGISKLSEKDQKYEHANSLGISLEDIELVKNHPDEFAQFKAKIAKGDNKPAFPSRNVTNPERREQRIKEHLSESPEKKYEERNRNVRTSRSAIAPSLWLKEQYTNEDGQMVCQICKKEMPFRKRNGQYYFEAIEAFSQEQFSMEHEAQFLALCPLCAAMYKELVKKDDAKMTDLIKVILNKESLEVPLRLGDFETTIKFVETHFNDIRTVVKESIESKGVSSENFINAN